MSLLKPTRSLEPPCESTYLTTSGTPEINFALQVGETGSECYFSTSIRYNRSALISGLSSIFSGRGARGNQANRRECLPQWGSLRLGSVKLGVPLIVRPSRSALPCEDSSAEPLADFNTISTRKGF